LSRKRSRHKKARANTSSETNHLPPSIPSSTKVGRGVPADPFEHTDTFDRRRLTETVRPTLRQTSFRSQPRLSEKGRERRPRRSAFDIRTLLIRRRLTETVRPTLRQTSLDHPYCSAARLSSPATISRNSGG